MKNIIIFPGKVDSVFFTNELPYIVKYFDRIRIFTYDGNKSKYLGLQKKYNVEVYRVKFSLLYFLKKKFIGWLVEPDTKIEFKRAYKNKKKFQAILYVIYYGLFYLSVEENIRSIISKMGTSDEIYLYSFWLSRGAYVIANLNLCRDNRVRLVVSRAHGYDLYEARNKTGYLPFREYLDRNLDKIYFISSQGREYFLSQNYCDSLPSSKKEISRLGSFNDRKLKKIIKVDKKSICIASCSSIIQVKRIDIIIRILSAINLPIIWVHIGDGNKKNEMVKLARNMLGKKENINFDFLGNINNCDILDTYIKLDVDYLINMSDSEGIPVTFMEALSIGIPVIARNVGGIEEIIHDNNGLIIKDINIVDIKIIEDFLNIRLKNPNIYKALSDECINEYEMNYSGSKNYDNFFHQLSLTHYKHASN